MFEEKKLVVEVNVSHIGMFWSEEGWTDLDGNNWEVEYIDYTYGEKIAKVHLVSAGWHLRLIRNIKSFWNLLWS